MHKPTDAEVSRKLFRQLAEDATKLTSEINRLLELANAMRRTLATMTQSLGVIEHRYVAQTSTLRDAHAELHEAKRKLDAAGDTLSTAAPEIDMLAKPLDNLKHQADRIESDIYIKDSEVGPPIPGVKYVDRTYFADKLGVSMSTVRNLESTGALPPHDAEIADGGRRAKFLWLETAAIVAVHRYMKHKATDPKLAVA